MGFQCVTENNFDGLVEGHKLLLIEFSAEWCAPCKDFAKVMEQLQPEFTDFVFAQVDIEKESGLASEFQVRSVPFVMIIKDKVVVYASAGAMPSSALKELLIQARDVSTDGVSSS